MQSTWKTGAARVHLDSPPPEMQGDDVRSPAFWLDETADCVDLEVEGTHFRVRRSRLCTHSESISRAMSSRVAGPQPPETIVVEGVDVQDFKEMMKAMDNAVWVPSPRDRRADRVLTCFPLP